MADSLPTSRSRELPRRVIHIGVKGGEHLAVSGAPLDGEQVVACTRSSYFSSSACRLCASPFAETHCIAQTESLIEVKTCRSALGKTHRNRQQKRQFAGRSQQRPSSALRADLEDSHNARRNYDR